MIGDVPQVVTEFFFSFLGCAQWYGKHNLSGNHFHISFAMVKNINIKDFIGELNPINNVELFNQIYGVTYRKTAKIFNYIPLKFCRFLRFVRPMCGFQ